MTTATITFRERAILRSVAAGHAELAAGAVPDLYLDGRCCCDQAVAWRLTTAGLIVAVAGATGDRVPAVLTRAGVALAA